MAKIWPIATAGVSALLVVGSAPGAEPAPVHEDAARAEPAPVRMGVVLNTLDTPFFVAIYERASAHARRLEVRATTGNADLAGEHAR